MNKYIGEYNGAALQSFLLALGESEAVVQRILTSCGLDRIDPDHWYELNVALNVYSAIERQIGRGALIAVGRKMIEAAAFPPGITSVRDVLASLDAAFHMNARGPETGSIRCTFDDDHSATLEWTAGGPCALNFGIIEGCCSRFGARAIIEHGATGCMERGASECIYFVSF